MPRFEYEPRPGLVTWRLKDENFSDHRYCERTISPHPIVGFSQRGRALIECNDVETAVSVPDVAIVRIRDPIRLSGFKYHRVAFKVFSTEQKPS